MKLVLDTNIIVSAIIFGGKPRKLVEAAQAGQVSLFASEELVTELSETLAKPKLRDECKRRHIDVATVMRSYREMIRLVHPVELTQPVSRDSDDDIVIATAIAAGADMIVTGDLDLLTLESHKGIRIAKLDEALAKLVG